MNIFTYTAKNQEEALKINGGKKFTSDGTLKYQDVNAIVELLLKVKEKISTKRLKQLNIMKEHLKGGLYSWDPFNFVMHRSSDEALYAEEVGFFFDTGEKILFADVDITPDVKVDIMRSTSGSGRALILYLCETQNLRNSVVDIDREIPYKINFYTDLSKTKLFASIDGVMNYKC